MRIFIGNVKHGDVGEYIGRAGYGRHGSPLGNPFVVGKHGARGECADKYDGWLDEQIARRNRVVLDELARLERIVRERGELTLVCWCAPARCHGESIVRALKARLSK